MQKGAGEIFGYCLLFPTTGVSIKDFALWLHGAWWGPGIGLVPGARRPSVTTNWQLRTGR